MSTGYWFKGRRRCLVFLLIMFIVNVLIIPAGSWGSPPKTRAAVADPPIIYGVRPGNMAFTFDRTPTISALLAKGGADLNPASITITLDGENVTASAQLDFDPAVQKGRLAFTPDADLSYGEHDVAIAVSDVSGQNQQYSWFFVIDGQLSSQPHFYYGNLHSHTSYSDGQGIPAEAYEYAYNEWLDFLAVTDHSQYLEGDRYDPAGKEFTAQPGSEWSRTADMARAFNNTHKDFLALRGFEMTFPELGHINVLNTDKYVEAVSTMTTLEEFYAWLAKQPGAVAEFNHPGWPDTSFDNLAYSQHADRVINLIETGNGLIPHAYTRFEEYYYKALDKGWHVGAVNVQDNHAANWGDADNLTVVVADRLTTDEFFRALRERRIYSTESRSLQLTVKGNGHWMGSVLDISPGDPLNLEILAVDDINPIAGLSLITDGGHSIAVQEVNGTAAEWRPRVIPGAGAHWYVVKVTHENGKLGFSSPIFTNF